MDHKENLTTEQREDLLEILKIRFKNNMHRHENMEWAEVQTKLGNNLKKLWSLHEMEKTGGEPDVVS